MTDATVVIASIQSMMRDERLERWPNDHFKLIVCDEAHHCISPSWQKVLQRFQAFVLGVTATPDRGDKRLLNDYFQSRRLRDDPDRADRSRLPRPDPGQDDSRQDRHGGSRRSWPGITPRMMLAAAIAPHLGEIARIMAKDYHGRKSLAFLPLIATSQAFVEACREAGLRAEHVDGTDTTDTRQGALARLASGETQLISNAMLFTEGIDCPPVDCIVPLRPTKIRITPGPADRAWDEAASRQGPRARSRFPLADQAPQRRSVPPTSWPATRRRPARCATEIWSSKWKRCAAII